MTSSLTAKSRTPTLRDPGVERSAPGDHSGRRPDIQGLRAVAVLLVVLDHAGVPLLGGGYVGVDAFFVISGFLITSLLLREHRATGRISLPRFYARRAVRLLPASTLVAVVTLAATWCWLPPARVVAIGWDALTAAGYGINIRLAAVATDYFANQAPSPLQHFWSLAVEEQFYLVWPLLIIGVLALRRRRRVLAAVLLVLCLASLGYSAYQVAHSAPWAYFGLPSRAWELGVGALVALAAPRLRRLPVRITAPLGWVGLLVLVGAAVRLDDTSAFPGLAAVAPVLGAAAVLIAGGAVVGNVVPGGAVPGGAVPGGAVPGGARPALGVGVSRLLGIWPLRVLGDLSYSWYLWHWPILVIVPVVVGHELGTATRLGLCAAALVAAAGTYRWVENPVRHRRALTARGFRGLALGLALSGGVALLAVVVIVRPPAIPRGAAAVDTRAVLRAATDQSGELRHLIATADQVRRVPANLDPALAVAARDMVRPQTDGCHLTLASAVREPDCTYGPADATRTVVVFGDSHALQWFPAFADLAERNHWRLISLTRSSCSPAAVTLRIAKFNRVYTECDPWRQSSLRRIHQERPDLVVVASSTNYPGMLADSPADPDQVWSQAWDRLFATLRSDARRVLLLADTPMLSQDPVDCLSTYATATDRCTEPATTVLRYPTWRAEVRDAARRAAVPVLDPAPWLCVQRCPLIVGNLLVYRDTNHLTSAYVEALSPLLARGLPGLA